MKEYKKDGTHIIKLSKRKVTAVKRKIQVWVVWDDGDERNGWEKIFPSKQNKQVDGS